MRHWTLAALAALQMGCAMKVVRGDTGAIGEQKIYKLHSFLWAFIPTKLPPANELCPGGQVQVLDLGQAPTDTLLTVVTLGAYVPSRAAVTCSNSVPATKN